MNDWYSFIRVSNVHRRNIMYIGEIEIVYIGEIERAIGETERRLTDRFREHLRDAEQNNTDASKFTG